MDTQSMMTKKITLTDAEHPRQWYNILADLPRPLNPPMHPATGQPLSPDDLTPLFPMGLIEQEVSEARFIDIPEPVLENLLLYRPSPLIRATRLEQHLKTPAKIYFKYEGVSPSGSHKTNTAVAQAYYNAREGVKKITTETGAGQWGCALSYACAIFGIDCTVFMVRVSYDQKPYRRLMMNTYGAECLPSPTTTTEVGRRTLAEHPDAPGSLGLAISEAVERAVGDKNTNYALGSVLNHVLLHQTVIGLEAEKQMKIAGDTPDVVIGCVGGGSNFGGLSLPYVRRKIQGDDVEIVGVEPTSYPTMTRGPFAYDFGDTGKMTPLLAMHTLGHGFVPPAIHAGGLRYHGVAPILSQLILDELIEPRAINQLETFEAGLTFARTEGLIPAPETCHAVAAAITEANRAREEGKERTILFSFSGHGLLDLTAYEAYMAGELREHALEVDAMNTALANIEELPKPSQASPPDGDTAGHRGLRPA